MGFHALCPNCAAGLIICRDLVDLHTGRGSSQREWDLGCHTPRMAKFDSSCRSTPKKMIKKAYPLRRWGKKPEHVHFQNVPRFQRETFLRSSATSGDSSFLRTNGGDPTCPGRSSPAGRGPLPWRTRTSTRDVQRGREGSRLGSTCDQQIIVAFLRKGTSSVRR